MKYKGMKYKSSKIVLQFREAIKILWRILRQLIPPLY